MKRYQITFYKAFSGANLYSIHEQGTALCETDQFFSRFMANPAFGADIQIIKGWMEKIGEHGALERYFKPEGKALAIPVPPPKSDLRLYCYRVSDEILIVGNGGIKTSKKVKDSPDCFPHYELMNRLAYIFEMKRAKGQIGIREGKVVGDLDFYIKEQSDE